MVRFAALYTASAQINYAMLNGSKLSLELVSVMFTFGLEA